MTRFRDDRDGDVFSSLAEHGGKAVSIKHLIVLTYKDFHRLACGHDVHAVACANPLAIGCMLLLREDEP